MKKSFRIKQKKHEKFPHGTPKQIHLSDLIAAGFLKVGDKLTDDYSKWTAEIINHTGKVKFREKIHSIQYATNELIKYYSNTKSDSNRWYNINWVSYWDFWNLKKEDEFSKIKFNLIPLSELKKRFIIFQSQPKQQAPKCKSKKERYILAQEISDLIESASVKPKFVLRVFESKQDYEDNKPISEKELDLTEKNFYNQFRNIENKFKKLIAEIVWKKTAEDYDYAVWRNSFKFKNGKNSQINYRIISLLKDWIQQPDTNE